MQRQRSAADARRAWIVLGATFISLGMVYGVWYSYSVFLVALLKEFGWSRSLVSGAFSLFVIAHGLLGPLNGWLAARVGPRPLLLGGGCVLGVGLLLVAETTAWWHLYLAFGLVVAVGVAFAGWLPSILLIRGWFPDRVGTALGIASAGIGIGITILVPLMQYLVDLVGWRWAYRILALLVAGWVVPASLWLIRNPPEAETVAAPGQATPGAVYWTLSGAVRSWPFWGLATVFCSGNVATQMLLVHQVAYLVDHGVSALVAAAIAGTVGLVSIPGKIGWGILSDRTNREIAYTLAFCCVIGSLGALVLAGRFPASSLPYVYAALLGLGYAATAPLTPAAASDVFGGPRFSVIFGTLHVSNAVGASSGPWIAGKIFDATGSYTAALWVALGMAVISMSVLWIVAPRRPHPPPPESSLKGSDR
ncbi:MAG: MFS transporter [Candidatus Methylomirabilota bacterium]